MALYYLETSALVKLYVQELGSERLLRLASEVPENRLGVLALSAVELRSAVRRRERAGDIDHATAGQILGQFQHHMEGKFVRQPISEVVLDGAQEMIDRYALRAYDAVQLSGCLALRLSTGGVETPTFVCSDHQLLDAARSELLPVLDPTI